MGIATALWTRARERRGRAMPGDQYRVPTGCLFRGVEPAETIDCNCANPVRLYECSCDLVSQSLCLETPVAGKRAAAIAGRDLAVCHACPHRAAPTTGYQVDPEPAQEWPTMHATPTRAAIAPLRRTRITGLVPNRHQLNGAIFEHAGRTHLVYRHGWSNAQIFLATLDADYRVLHDGPLPIPRRSENMVGCEDPRVFRYDGSWWVAFTGVSWERGRLVTHVQIARLGDTLLDVRESYVCTYPRRRAWEKNWGFFEHDNQLMAVYDCGQQRTLACHDRTAGYAHFHLHDFAPQEVPEPLGLLRGGASPVKHLGEWYSFAHGVYRHGDQRHYHLALYTFSARCPFRWSRVIESPLLLPTPFDQPADHVPHCVYPCGAMRRDNKWVVSYGYYDKWVEVVEYDANELEQLLVPAAGSYVSRLARRPGADGQHDLRIWTEVYSGDEYQVPTLALADLVVDVGCHIGSFAARCLDRGAGHVTAYEPDPTLASLARQNLQSYGSRVTIHQAAAGPYYPLGGQSPVAGVASTTPELLDGRTPIRLLKLDCEGAEHWIVRHCDLSRVQEIVGESHTVPGHDVHDLWPILESLGFRVTWTQPGETCLFRAVRS